MKLFIGNKNPPFALDVALDGSVLSFSVRSVMQQEFVGDPSKLHTNGGKFFDQALIAEWRGGFGVFGDPIYQRTLDLETLRQHAEFSDHASFMLYAPVGVMERYGTPSGFFQQTPNLYVATLGSKMDAQAYHASVLQTHPIGHILVPFRSSPFEDWTLGFNVFSPELIKASHNIEVIPAITLALVREETFKRLARAGESIRGECLCHLQSRLALLGLWQMLDAVGNTRQVLDTASQGIICPAGYWTIGYGRLCDPKHPPISVEEGDVYLAHDLMTAANATLRYCPVLATEPDSRLAAIVDFTFNLGAGRLQTSTLRRRINQRDWLAAGTELRRWVFGGGKVLPGLVARREAEAAWLLHNPRS